MWIIAGYAGEPTGNLDDEQVELVAHAAPVNLSSKKQEKMLSLGLVDSAITKLNHIYPYLDITNLDRTAYANHIFDLSNEPIAWENQYDTIAIYLALEKSPDRNERLRILYKGLKPGGKGIIVFAPKDSCSIDNRVEQFIENSEWKPFISNTPNLSLEDYRMLIQNIGFNIIGLRNWVSILRNTDTSEWLCDRWEVPLSMQSRFIGGFYRFSNMLSKGETCFFTGLYYFIVEK